MPYVRLVVSRPRKRPVGMSAARSAEVHSAIIDLLWCGWSAPEIAAVMGVTRQAVQMRLHYWVRTIARRIARADADAGRVFRDRMARVRARTPWHDVKMREPNAYGLAPNPRFDRH